MTEPGALPPDRLPAEHRVRPRWLRLLIGRRPGTPSTSPWEPWVHAVGFALVFTVAGAVLSGDGSLADRVAAGVGIALFLGLSGELSRRRRLAGRSSLTWLPLALLAAVFLVVSAMRERQADELDYAALCREAQAPVATPEQVLAIDARIDAVFLAAEGNHRPTSAELPMFRASALLGAEAETAGAPYRLPADLRGSLPAMPDLTKVRALQSELAAACR